MPSLYTHLNFENATFKQSPASITDRSNPERCYSSSRCQAIWGSLTCWEMAWEGISVVGKPNLVISNGNLRSLRYRDAILAHHVLAHPAGAIGDGYQLVGDNGYCLLVWLLSSFVQVIHVTCLVELA